jgi:integrase
MRAGEILGLRKSDIDNMVGSRLNIVHGWAGIDGLKITKTNTERKVILYPEIKAELLKLLAENPHKVDDPFIFYSIFPDQPMDNKILLKYFYEACTAAGIDYKGRGICFHSHRHYYSTNMVDRLAPEKVMRATGHLSKKVFDGYADHELESTLEEVSKTGEAVFKNILQFHKKVG